MCTLPIDIIGKIANYVGISDITSFLISFKDLSNLINKELANKLAEIYNLPFVTDFQKLLYYAKFCKYDLTMLSIITDDLRLFKAHYPSSHYDLLEKNITRFGSINICDYIFENLLDIVRSIDPYDILKRFIKNKQYTMISHILEKFKTKIKLSKNIYKYVFDERMLKLLMIHLPLDVNDIEIVKTVISYCKTIDVILFLLESINYSGKLLNYYIILKLMSHYSNNKEIVSKIFNILIKNNNFKVEVGTINVLARYDCCEIHDLLLKHINHQELIENLRTLITNYHGHEHKLKVINLLLKYYSIFENIVKFLGEIENTELLIYLISIKESIPKEKRQLSETIHKKNNNKFHSEKIRSLLIRLDTPYYPSNF